MPAHTVSLIIIEPSDQFSHQRLDQLVGSSLPQLARFRSRLVGRPLGVGRPLWAEIHDYDPTSQIHRATIRAPGGRRDWPAPDRATERRIGDRRRSSVGSLEHRRSVGWPVGASGADVACTERRRCRRSVRVVAALALRCATVPGRCQRARPDLGMPTVGEARYRTVMTELLSIRSGFFWLVAAAPVTCVLGAVGGRLLGTSEA